MWGVRGSGVEVQSLKLSVCEFRDSENCAGSAFEVIAFLEGIQNI